MAVSFFYRVILVLQDNHQVLPTGAFQAANMEVGQLLEPPMEAQHPVVHMGHHLVEDHMATHPLPPQGICMEEAQHQEGLMGNHLLIHMALLSPDPMGQEVLAVSAKVSLGVKAISCIIGYCLTQSW